MADIPVTSVSLLKDISSGAQHARWTEFFLKYERPMRDFLHERFPSVEADDAIQETMLALIKALPDYHYTPDANGHFHNYLIGILKHKAMDLLTKSSSHAAKLNALKNEHDTGLTMSRNVDGESGSDSRPMIRPQDYEPEEDDAWKRSVMEAAMEQLMSDRSVTPRNREVFRHVAVLHEPPEKVAEKFGILRNNVDQIKNRMIGRLSTLVEAMTKDY